jgi:hypothetical protein
MSKEAFTLTNCHTTITPNQTSSDLSTLQMEPTFKFPLIVSELHFAAGLGLWTQKMKRFNEQMKSEQNSSKLNLWPILGLPAEFANMQKNWLVIQESQSFLPPNQDGALALCRSCAKEMPWCGVWPVDVFFPFIPHASSFMSLAPLPSL